MKRSTDHIWMAKAAIRDIELRRDPWCEAKWDWDWVTSDRSDESDWMYEDARRAFLSALKFRKRRNK
jgi:hypothetical protein